MKRKSTLVLLAGGLLGGAGLVFIGLGLETLAAMVAMLMLAAILVVSVSQYSQSRSLASTAVRRLEGKLAAATSAVAVRPVEKPSGALRKEDLRAITESVGALEKSLGKKISSETNRALNGGALRVQRQVAMHEALRLQLEEMEAGLLATGMGASTAEMEKLREALSHFVALADEARDAGDDANWAPVARAATEAHAAAGLFLASE